MKSHTEHLVMHTKRKQEFVNITQQIDQAVVKSGIQEGLVLINPMHITAAVYVNDNESGLINDFQVWLEKLAPAGLDYKHHWTGEDNADAHLKRQLIGHQVTMAVTKGKLELGPWEQIFYAEFDGQRQKRILIKIIGE